MNPQTSVKQMLGDGAALIRAQLADDQRGAAMMLRTYPHDELLALAAATSAIAAALLVVITETTGGNPDDSLNNFLEGLDTIG